MRDIRILTLYKQFYLDYYNNPLRCEYSCWGYYDGITVKKAANTSSKLFEKRTKAPISELWYGMSKSVNSLDGGYSKQDIGVFRCAGTEGMENGNVFWKEHSKMPVFGVGFLQLKDKQNYKKVSSGIENKYLNPDIRQDHIKYRALTYCTFDNADLIVFIHGNSIRTIEEIMRDIGADENVVCCYSTIGVSERYLQGKQWKGYMCLEEEEIARITMKIVTSGGDQVCKWIKDQMPVCKAGNITYSKVSGHENMMIEIVGTDVRTLLMFLRPKGFLTHQNPLYGKWVYNIETSVRIQEEKWGSLTGEKFRTTKGDESSWFAGKIRQCREKLNQAFRKGDEGLYSYYQALIQMLNSLIQYEKFTLAKDMFYLLFPSFELFFSQLEKGLRIDKKDKQMKEDMKVSICNYLESVNSVIYHIIHTDQMFLMIPGYSGTTYAVPIKLCLLYSWFIRHLISIINDSDGYKYQCLLIPVIESKPLTNLISMGLPHGDRLIGVRLSQRTLYMPRALMLILSHEVAHYVGDGIRNRALRIECIIKTMAFALSEGIIPDKTDGSATIIQELRTNKRAIQKKIMGKMRDRIKENGGNRYHASQVESSLKTVCEELLADERYGIYPEIYQIPSTLLEKIKNDKENYVKNMEEISSLQRQFDHNRRELLANGVSARIFKKLIEVYQEVFSDIVAVTILDADMEFYEEAFRISEGAPLSIEDGGVEALVRERVMETIYDGAKMTETGVAGDEKEDIPRIEAELFMYNGTLEMLDRYARTCYKDINELISEDKKQETLQKLREIFKMFGGEREYTCQEIYDMIIEKIHEYENEVEDDYIRSKKEYR